MNLTNRERKKCSSIIHSAAGAAAFVGSGMAQFPLSDALVLAPIQIGMITALGSVFDAKVTESVAKGLLASFTASCVGRATSQILLGWVPVLGNIINASTASGLTEAVGWLTVEHFYTEQVLSGPEEIISRVRKKLNRTWRKAKIFCEERLEDLEKQFSD